MEEINLKNSKKVPSKVELIRISNLRKISDDVGGISKLANIIDRDKSQVSQIIGKTIIAPFKETIARRIEEKLIDYGLDIYEGWLDQKHSEQSETQELIPLGKTIKSSIRSVNSAFANSGEITDSEDSKMLDEVLEDEMEAIKLERKHAFWLKIKDDSMKPYIEPGTLTMIDKSRRNIKDGKRYAFKIDGKIVLRRVYRENGFYKICCDNIALKAEIRDRIVENFHGDVELIGKMVFIAMKDED